eukprot:COSAG01_NODE_68994_length_262_cov_1.460123_1_plen_54_part_10
MTGADNFPDPSGLPALFPDRLSEPTKHLTFGRNRKTQQIIRVTFCLRLLRHTHS